MRYLTPGGAGAASKGCHLVYIGADDGTILDINRSGRLLFDGWSFSGHDLGRDPNWEHGAVRGINVSNSRAPLGTVCTDITFQNFAIEPGYPADVQNWQGVHIGDPSGNNCEFMTFRHGSVTGLWVQAQNDYAGTGFYLEHVNVKSIKFEDVGLANLDVGVESHGSFNAYGMKGSNVELIYKGGCSEPCQVLEDNFESIRQVYGNAGLGGTMRWQGGRYGGLMSSAGTSQYPLWDFAGATAIQATVEDFGFSGSGSSVTDIFKTGANTALTVKNPDMQWALARRSDPGYIQGGLVNDLSSAAVGGFRTNAGFNLLLPTGQSTPGVTAAAWALGTTACGAGNVCLNNGQIEFLSPYNPSNPARFTVQGAPGATTYQMLYLALDSSGNKTMASPLASVANGPALPDSTNYLTIAGEGMPGAASCDLIQRHPQTGQYHKFASIACASAWAYDLKSDPNPGNDWSYTLPTANGAMKTVLRGAVQGPALFGSAPGGKLATTALGSDPAAGNCVRWASGGKLDDAGAACGSAGGGGLSGSGTVGAIPKFVTNSTTLGDSFLKEDGNGVWTSTRIGIGVSPGNLLHVKGDAASPDRQPGLTAELTGGVSLGRFKSYLKGLFYNTINLGFTGTNWNLDTTSQAGAGWTIANNESGYLTSREGANFVFAVPASNPVTPVIGLHLSARNGRIWFGKTAGDPPLYSELLAKLTVEADDTATVAEIVRGSSGQTADLEQWQNSSKTVLARIDKDGKLSTPAISGITDTTEVASLNAQKWHGKDALDFSNSLDFSSISAGTCSAQTVTVTGAATGNAVAPAWPSALENGLTGIMFVSAANTVSVRLCNVTASSINPAAQTFAGRVIK